jgi:hypothetical protein
MRRSGFLVLTASALAASCGRQVTPDRSGSNASGLNSGQMSVKFDVQAPFNFSSYAYAIVFNTSGTTQTPEAFGSQNNYAGYSFAIVVGSTTSGVQAAAYQFIPPSNNPSGAPTAIPLVIVSGQLQFYPNTNGQGTEFNVIFDRSITNGITTPSPLPSGTATPTPSPTPTATPTPTPTPAGASPSPTPTASGTTPPQDIWYFNFFVAQPLVAGSSLQIIDSLGAQGGKDATYQSMALDTTQVFSGPTFYTQAPGSAGHPSDPAAQIVGGTISNNP